MEYNKWTDGIRENRTWRGKKSLERKSVKMQIKKRANNGSEANWLAKDILFRLLYVVFHVMIRDKLVENMLFKASFVVKGFGYC